MTNTQNWVPVALSNAVEPATSTGAVVDGAEIVVWRDNKGMAHIWEDRCPHRGMRMSFGFVRGDHIACLYHGWQYDVNGQCQHIPAHPDLDVPKTIKVQTYSAVERQGLIWVGFTDSADPASIPDIGATTPVRSIYVATNMDHAAGMLSRFGKPTQLGPFCWSLEMATATLIVGGQTVAPGSIALHILIAGAADAEARKTIARWAESLRRTLEQKSGVRAVAEPA
jgi:nitrite reductase/ring-hydroxylating ferredoxin subunit